MALIVVVVPTQMNESGRIMPCSTQLIREELAVRGVLSASGRYTINRMIENYQLE